METRGRKRAQAFEQARFPPDREKKKPNMSSTSSAAAAPTPHHRYPTRRLSQAPTQTSNMQQDSIPTQTTRSKKKRSADILIIEDIAQHQSESPQMEENTDKPTEKGKEKEIPLEVKDKGKNQEFVSQKDIQYPHKIQANIKVEKNRYVHLGGSYSMTVIVNILSNLKSGNELMQIDSLTQLCEVLCMGNENTLADVPVHSFVPELVKILNNDNPELMLLAARALTQLCEMIPMSCNALVNHGAVPHFCGILQSIQYIDVAEQSLQALFKISREHPGPCLRAGGLTAVLSNFDFYSTGVQRVAVSTAANMCKRMPPEGFNYVNEALPILTNLLEYSDSKVVEHASVCLIRIAESFTTSWEKLDILCMHGLIPAALRLVSVDHSAGDMAPQTSLSSSTYTGLVRLLSICASGSSVAAESLLEMKISSIVKDILTTSGQSVSAVVMNMPSQQLCEIVTLISVLLPPTPQLLVPANSPQNEAKLLNSNATTRKQPLCDQPSLLAQFGMDLFPVLVQVYGASLNPTVRSTSLDAIRKLVYFSSADILRSIFEELNISSFLVGLLASKDPTPQIAALQIADLLMQKLQDHFQKVFIKEGVLHTISTQFGLELANLSPPGDRLKRRSKKVSNVATDSESIKDEKGTQSGVAPSEAPKKDPMSLAISLAQKFKDTYFRSSSGTSETATFKKLKKLCSTLSSEPKVKGKIGSMLPANDEAMTAALVEILSELGKGGSVSTFEFVGCGIIESLLHYFSCGNHHNEKLSTAELRQKAFERLQLFFGIATSCSNKATEPLLTLLVRKLQSALASLELFPVKLTRQPAGNNSSSHTVGLNALAHPIKLQFCRLAGEKNLRDYPSNIVLVSPLTTLSSVEHYLWPHVRGSDAQMSSALPSTSTPIAASIEARLDVPVAFQRFHELGKLADIDANAAIKIKGKQKLDHTIERKGPETRSIAERRRQAAAASVHVEAYPEVEDVGIEFYGSEDEEIFTTDDEFYSEDDRDDHGQVRLVSEEESTVCDVYEVLLGDDTTGHVADEKLMKGVTGSTSTSGREVAEDSLEGCVVVPGASSLSAPARLCFFFGGKSCDRSWTVLKAIQNRLASNVADDERFAGLYYDRWFLDKLHTFGYQQVHPGMNSQNSPSDSSSSRQEKGPGVRNVCHTTLFLDKIVQRKLPCDLNEASPTYNILLMLYILEGLNRLAPRFQITSGQERAAPERPVSSEEFVSSKLMPKMVRQMQDALALCSGNLPPWCHQLIQACPFLFSFESRRQYFYLTSFGLPRALHRLQQQQIASSMASSNDRETRVNRLRRRKVRISRDCIVESAMKVMDLFSKDKGVLEVEYFGEVGTGLGPTLEFYTLLSQELQKASLGMWRSSSFTDDDFGEGENKNGVAYTPFGLFPRPWQQSSPNHETILNYFRLLGQVVGKALQDGRLLDLPLSNLFYKLLLEQELDLYDIKFFDFELGSNLEQMHKLVAKKKQPKALKRSSKESKRGLRLHNTKIEDLSLYFTLPGYPDYMLKPCGDNIMVDSENLEEYITLVVDASVKTGILPQVDAFRSGFNQVFPISTLQIFTEEELSYMLCGLSEMWQPETLVEHLRFDHGYNASSPPIKYLLEIMGGFHAEQQRAFLQFVTGAPQLPCGGLSALRPKLTIVRKLPSGANGDTSPTFVDGDLPSVMTCANYLKLPPYSCKEVMLERLLYAIREGQGSFDLS